jgi:hypothetical protein
VVVDVRQSVSFAKRPRNTNKAVTVIVGNYGSTACATNAILNVSATRHHMLYVHHKCWTMVNTKWRVWTGDLVLAHATITIKVSASSISLLLLWQSNKTRDMLITVKRQRAFAHLTARHSINASRTETKGSRGLSRRTKETGHFF